MQKLIKLIVSIGIPLFIGFASSYFTDTGSWYQSLNKPSWNPPGWLFGPVWTILYIMMGIALYIIWQQPIDRRVKRIAVILFAIQLSLNFFWSFIFFEMQLIFPAFIEIIVLWSFIFLTILSFAKINKMAAWLLVPYISWVSFAAYLNFTIWILNKN